MLAPVLVPALAALACGQDNRILVPNRVLDRPLDVVLACVRDSGSQVEVLSLNQCAGSNPGRCEITDSPTPQLIGFVANSERNELAMFRRCDREAALVDMDPEAPGYSLLPAGVLPSSLTITSDSCRVISANAGSCDFTTLDVPGLGAYAINTKLTGSASEPAPEPPDLPPPSSLVSTLVPRRSDGRPLASSPGEILAVPSALSLAGEATDPGGGGVADDGADSGGSDGFDPGDPDTGGGGDGGGSEPIPEGTVCDLTSPASIYVTFPACQLVAEVSLGTQSILQSRQWVTNAAGEIEVIDSGSDPVCPVDCPAQLDGDLPDEIELVDPAGVFPSALALVVPPAPNVEVDAAEQEVSYAALFVGGPGSDAVYEIEIDENGRFGPVVDALPLEGAHGVQTIRVTPAAEVFGDAHQFIYAIAGDGSTRVVDRDFDPGVVGIECDTQIDPTLEPPNACHPIDPGQAGNAIDRRPFAVGPGIRSPLGATINDWAFHKLTAQEAADTCGGDVGQTSDSLQRTPFCAEGMVGVGVTSLGTVVYSSFGQFSDDESVSLAVDPVGIMQVQVRPHSLWPAVDPFAANPLPEALPLVADEEPGLSVPGTNGEAEALSPSLRRIDLAYSAETGVSEEQVDVSLALGGVENVDRLGSLDGSALYESFAPRVAVRDFQQWASQTWRLEWEPTVPGADSTTGLLQCDRHGSVDADGNEVPGGTCRATEPDDARLVDESANFCEDGVLPGDKLIVLGCVEDDTCGPGQVCLRDPTGPVTASGICVSQQAYDTEREALRDACAPFIRNACGSAERAYRITRATDDELWLQSLERPERSVVRNVLGARSPVDATVDLYEYTTKLTCDSPVVRLHRELDAEGNEQLVETETCQEDADCFPDPYDPDNQRGALTCQPAPTSKDPGRQLCTGQQPDGGCDDDEGCVGLGAQYVCVDAVCRAPCNLCPPAAQPADPCQLDQDCVDAGTGSVCMAGLCHEPCDEASPSCLLSPLPGPRCFSELTRYSVRLHESFSFTGSSTQFLTDRVVVDPDTGECVEDEEVSSLLTSRIRLGANAEETFGTGPWQIRDCVNLEEAGPDDPNPCRITIDRASDPASLFHRFAYQGQPVPAIRFSNPVMSVTIDLVSLTGLTGATPNFLDTPWPVAFAEFLRARIPAGYREDFASINGFVPFNEGVVVGNIPMVYPVRIIRAPEANGDFIVDAGGRGGAGGVRGQVIRIDHGPGQVLTDAQFRVR